MEYNLFIPPTNLLHKSHKNWDSIEAKNYFTWFLSIRYQRIDEFINTLSIKLNNDTTNDINEVGKVVTSHLFLPIFSERKGGIIELTNKGYAFVTDYAIFISECLIKNYPAISWKIVSRPKKDISYNLPSLFGFSKIDHIDMIRGAIANGKAILRKEEFETIWLKMYNYCISVL